MNQTITQDGWGGAPIDWGKRGNYGKTSLSEHDKKYHNGHYDGGDCKYRNNLAKKDYSDQLMFPSFEYPSHSSYSQSTPSFSHHGLFDLNNKISPQELDQMAVELVCSKAGVKYPRNGQVKSGRWDTAKSTKLQYTVLDPNTGLFASGRGQKDYMVLARPEEAMSFSDKADAQAVAKATSNNAVVLDKKGYNAFVSRKVNNTVEFPKTLTEGDLKGFRVTMNGSTEPFVGKIGNSMFIAKRGSHTSADHVRNEHIANELHRQAGLNAPKSKVYEIEGVPTEDKRTPAQKYMDEINGRKLGVTDTVMLSEYIPNAVSLEAAWKDADANTKAKIRKQVAAAYPFEAFIAGIDVFQNDNALVDSDGKLWFVDNGAAFDYRARGEHKGWFNNRTDIDDPKYGLMSMYNHKSQFTLRQILGKDFTKQDALREAKRYNFTNLVKSLPSEYQTPGLITYAKEIDVESAKI